MTAGYPACIVRNEHKNAADTLRKTLSRHQRKSNLDTNCQLMNIVANTYICSLLKS